jgi:tellurite methyltransferase
VRQRWPRRGDRLAANGLLDRVTLIEADLDVWRPVEGCDLVTCFFFLDRRLWPALRAAVRPGGLICLSTFHTGRLVAYPETNPAHLLAPGELSALIEDWNWRLLAARTDDQIEAVFGMRAGDFLGGR